MTFDEIKHNITVLFYNISGSQYNSFTGFFRLVVSLFFSSYMRQGVFTGLDVLYFVFVSFFVYQEVSFSWTARRLMSKDIGRLGNLPPLGTIFGTSLDTM